MYRVVVDGGIEQYEKHMPTSHWRKTKIPSINYIRDTPFATDRQLEDQRLLIERNRNPRSFEPTKVDKVRSETIIAPIGASRDVAVKANILNKIVREASGVYDYTIIPPPRLRPIIKKHEILEPELNPKVRPYAKESKMKPTVCSFGHRPSSASRTFHPATMKFRLKHGEIAPTGDNPTRTGFGLPVSVLKQVLYAPKIHSVPPMSPNNSTIADSADLSSDNRDLLFFSADEEQSMFGTTLPTKATDSWVSSIADDSLSTKEDLRYTSNASITSKGIASDDRPAWVESHHLIHVPNSVLFRAKKSVLAEAALLPLSDRLKRFTKLSVSQTQQSFACTEKQLTDQRVLRGEVLKPPKSTPIKGKPLFVDPTFARIVELEYLRKLREKDREVKRKADKYQEMLWTIPQADYYPTSALAEIRSHSSTMQQINKMEGGENDMNTYFDNSTLKSNDYTLDSLEEVSALTNQNSSVNRTTRSITTYDSSILDENEEEWKHLEAGYKNAMRAARAGDSEALYRFNMMNVQQKASTNISDDG